MVAGLGERFVVDGLIETAQLNSAVGLGVLCGTFGRPPADPS